jgi:citrate synthase
VATLKETLAKQIPAVRQKFKDLAKAHGNKIIDHVTLEQILGGMRGINCLVCDTSSVPPDRGLIIRGKPVAELAERLPEEIFWLLMTGSLPDAEGLKSLQDELRARATVPDYVWKVLDAMPDDVHPMCLFSTGILCMERESVFHKRYNEGLKREDFWEPTLEDALNIIAKVPAIAAGIYRKKFKKGPRIQSDPALTWGANYARMLGVADPKGEFTQLMNLFLVLHCDHENGNVSAMTSSTVNSALSDLYYAVSAGMNGLAGPLHGLANQECLGWIQDVIKKFNGVPTREQMRDFASATINSGKVIPGYGHGVLRVTDPRFTCFYDFGQKHCPADPVFKTVATAFDVVPDVLKQVQKIKDPWPNVDAASGALLHHYGLAEPIYYTVLFGVSRTLGLCAQSTWYRALGQPITRPKSVTSEWLAATAPEKPQAANRESARI